LNSGYGSFQQPVENQQVLKIKNRGRICFHDQRHNADAASRWRLMAAGTAPSAFAQAQAEENESFVHRRNVAHKIFKSAKSLARYFR